MKNKIILAVIRFLSKFLTPADYKVGYKRQGFQDNTIESVSYPLSYILTTHEHNMKRGFVVDKGTFKLSIERNL
jgi:hypothetical protein